MTLQSDETLLAMMWVKSQSIECKNDWVQQ
jgi:hypothetical protein